MFKYVYERFITGVLVLSLLAAASATMLVTGCPGASNFFGGVGQVGGAPKCELDGNNCITNLPCEDDLGTVHQLGDEPCRGVPPPRPICNGLASTVSVFPSSSRSILIRDDKDAGHAQLTVTASSEATSFTWCVQREDPNKHPNGLGLFQFDPPLGGDGCVTTNSDTESGGTTGHVDITKVIGDPGPGNAEHEGEQVTIAVLATLEAVDDQGRPVPCAVPGGAPITLQVRRPEGPLVAVLTPRQGSAVAPGETLTLQATITGGTPYPEGSAPCPNPAVEGDDVDPLRPRNDGEPYCLTWSVDECQLCPEDCRARRPCPETRRGVLSVIELPGTDTEGTITAVATYRAAAAAVGNVVFTVNARDAGGNQDTATIPVVVRSKVPLGFKDASATPSVVAPGESVLLKATGSGGEVPYQTAFKLLTTGFGVNPVGKSCTPLVPNQSCATYGAPNDRVGAVLISVELTDAVGAKVSNSIPLTVASSETLSLALDFGTTVVFPNLPTDITAMVQGGTKPYTVCYQISSGGGSLSGGDSDCVAVSGLTNPTCVCHEPLKNLVFTAPGAKDTATITAKVRDGVNNIATAVASVNVNEQGSGGGGGGGGGGGVTLALAVDHPAVCAGSTEKVRITATATGGTNNDFTFVPVAGLTQVSESSSELKLDYAAPATVGTQPITVTVTSGGGSNASQTVNIESRSSSCSDGNGCTDDVCDFGVCKNTVHVGLACGDQTFGACDDEDTCDANGVCQPNHKPDGPKPGCNSSTPCTNDACQAGVCMPNQPKPIGTLCDNATITTCDGRNTCDAAGHCLDNFAPVDTPCGNQTTTDCTDPDTCDGGGACQSNHLANGTLCTDDGNACTSDACNAGVCAHPPRSAGTACGDPTNSECTNPDTCNGAGVCLSNHEAAGTACGNAAHTDCTNPDTCDGSGVCQSNHEANGNACTDDLNDCTSDVCQGGVCVHPPKAIGASCGSPVDTTCNRADTCDGAGVCRSNFAPVDTPCGNQMTTDCTDPDTCDGGGACLANHLAAGTICTDDGNACTTDTCNATGVCTHPARPAGSACGDGSNTECTDPDTCNGAGVCLANHEPPGTPCGDPTDDDCANPDTCNGAGACLSNDVPNGDACADDGNDCTNDICQTGTCVHPFKPVGSACGDPSNTTCTLPDTCNAVGVCQSNHLAAGTLCGSLVDDTCTDPDRCDGLGACDAKNAPNGTLCNDLDSCNIGESCQTGVCTGGAAPDCSLAGDQCNVASCNPAATEGNCDTLTPVLDGTGCDDGLFCNGTETCDAGVCGSSTGDPCSASGQTCDEGSDRCVACLVNGDCGGATPFCETGTHLCVECLIDGDCDFPDTCNPITHVCE